MTTTTSAGQPVGAESPTVMPGSTVDQCPAIPGADGAYWAWVGTHGGAGVSTLAQAVPGGVDLGRRTTWQLGLSGLPTVAVCRGTASGLSAARDFAGNAGWPATVLGLVVVADIPERRRPKPLADSLYLTRGAFDQVWEMPWVGSWRLGETPSPGNNPPQVRDLLRALWTAVNLPLPGGTNQQRSRS